MNTSPTLLAALDKAVDDWSLGDAAFRLLYLMVEATDADGHCTLSDEALAQRRGTSPSAVSQLMHQLAELDYITRPPPPPRCGPEPVDVATRWAIWERDDFTCRRCGSRRYLTIDHIWPQSRGGTNDLENLQTLCKRCNSAKRDRVPAGIEADNGD